MCANIAVEQSELHGLKRVVIRGEFELGDEDRFKNAVFNLDRAIVVFDSSGGLLKTGIDIGEMIHLAKFDTAVEDGGSCASACGVAWLGGANRYLYGTGRVGFHAAYRTDYVGQNREVGVGNALVGAFLNKLGMTSIAIEFLTENPPKILTG